jgi:hypothetical protein
MPAPFPGPWEVEPYGLFNLQRLEQAPWAQTGGRERHEDIPGSDDRRPIDRFHSVLMCGGLANHSDRHALRLH